MKRTGFWLLALALWLVACAPATLLGGEATPAPTPTPLPTAVVPEKPTYTVQRGEVIDSLAFTGRVSPVEDAELYFRTDGRVLQIYVGRGDAVLAGDLLAGLDVSALRRQLAQAELALAAAQTDLQSAEAQWAYELARAQLNLELEQIALQKLQDYDPDADLAVAEAELEQATVDLQQAQSRYDAVADRPDIGMLPEAEALQQATLAYARAKSAYDRAVEQVGQHTYNVQSQQKRVALVRLDVKRLETGVDPRLEQAVAKAELDLAQMAAASDCFRWGAGVEADDTRYILNLGPFPDTDPSFPRDGIYPVFWQMCEQQGAIWCLPFDGDANVIRYNPTLFDAAGLAYPQAGWTLDDFLARAVALTRGEGAGKQYGFSSYGLEGVAFHVFVRIRGGSLWNLDLSPPRPRFDEPEVVEAVQMYADLVRVHGVKPAVHFGLSAEEWRAEIEPTMLLVQTGKAAMWVGFASISQYQPAGIASAGIVPLPQQEGQGVSSVWGHGHYISAQTQHPQACWAWLRFLVDRLEPVTGIPPRRSLAESAALRQKVGDDVAAVYLHVMEQSDDPASQMTA